MRFMRLKACSLHHTALKDLHESVFICRIEHVDFQICLISNVVAIEWNTLD